MDTEKIVKEISNTIKQNLTQVNFSITEYKVHFVVQTHRMLYGRNDLVCVYLSSSVVADTDTIKELLENSEVLADKDIEIRVFKESKAQLYR